MDMTYDYQQERRLGLLFFLVAFIALSLGGLIGLVHALEHAAPVLPGINLNFFPLPAVGSYYQGLTIHGVLNALVWTTFFASGFLLIATSRSLGRAMAIMPLSWLGFVLMLVGTALTVYTMFTGAATVLYTFYLPVQAAMLHYLGLILMIVGTWLHSVNFFATWNAWRGDNPGIKIPLAAFGSIAAWIVWDLATIAAAAELIMILLRPQTTSPLLGRTLFWVFGQGLTYAWLLSAFTAWFSMLPKMAGGKLYSDPMARIAIVLVVIFALPAGLSNQYTDPGISPVLKTFANVFAYLLAFPGMMALFNTVASLEYSGRARGGKGIGWLFRLPWSDPGFTAMVLSMFLFGLGGMTALIGASYSLSLVVQNTTWTQGTLHLLLGAGVTLTFMGITNWFLPFVTQRRLFSNAIGVGQAWLWFLGMTVFSLGMLWGGLMDAPYRTPFAQASYTAALVEKSGGMFSVAMALVAVGGLILTLSAIMYIMNVLGTLTVGQRTDAVDVPLADAVTGPEYAPASLDRWRGWVGIAVVLLLLVYLPALLNLL
jgi:cytochrome c oxidase subunit I